MKSFILTIASILLLCNISFGQRIEWNVDSSHPYVIYVDQSKIAFSSPDGIISGWYELLSDGRTLQYEVTIAPHVSGPIYEVGVSAFLDEATTEPAWWDYLYQPYTFGHDYFYGSVYLDYDEPKQFVTAVSYLNLAPNWMDRSFWTFSTYYPE